MLVYHSMEIKVREVNIINTKKDMESFIEEFRVLASNHRNNKAISDMADKAIQRCEQLNDQKSLVKLYEIKISQIEHLHDYITDVLDLVHKMKDISREIKYISGLALAYNVEWYVEKYRGNKERSRDALEDSMKYISQDSTTKDYAYYVCNYSFAVERWLTEHDVESSVILEECADYYYKKGFYRSFVQTIAILEIIFTRMQKGNRILKKCKTIFANKLLFEKLPNDVKAISYYFAGLGYMIDMNLNFAETYFGKAYDILKPIYKESIYFSNFIILHSYIITVKALQGKLEQTMKTIREVESLLKQGFYDKNLDLRTKNQIYHTLNLNKFYVYSRLKDFDSEEMQDLIEEIFKGSKTLYSDFMLLNEFILNSNLKTTQLKELLTANNFSINRVQHIISFVLLGKEEEDNTNKQFSDRIEILTNRGKDSKTTFIESVFADLLIVQQLFILRRYNDIYPLLRKYEKQLNRIEVFELRVFMEAFIQVGIFKIGDPLGPALQYMAIKKCRQYGFSRLENKLLDYLNIQGDDTLRMIV